MVEAADPVLEIPVLSGQLEKSFWLPWNREQLAVGLYTALLKKGFFLSEPALCEHAPGVLNPPCLSLGALNPSRVSSALAPARRLEGKENTTCYLIISVHRKRGGGLV